MTANKTLEQLKLELKAELESSLLLDETDREFWLANLADLPITTVQKLLAALQPKNRLVNSYIEAALEKDTNGNHLRDLQNQIKKIKRDAFKIEEKSDTSTEQKMEEVLLSKLDDV